MVPIQPDHDLRGVASPSNVRVPIILFVGIKVLNGRPLDRFLFFSLFSVVIPVSIACAHRILTKRWRLARHRRSLGHSFPRLLSLLRGTTTICHSLFCLDCELALLTLHPIDAHTAILSGVFSTVFIFMLDVEKSRIECDEFVAAEARHGVFNTNK